MTASDPNCNTCATSGIYHVHFLMQHPSDKALSHPQSRWWPQWNRFLINPLDHVVLFGLMQLFPPSTTRDPSIFAAWSTAVPLSLTLPATCLAPLTSSPASLLLTAAPLFRPTFGIASFPFASPVGLSPLHYHLLLAHLGSLAPLASSPTLLEPPPVSPSYTDSGVFLSSVASFLDSNFVAFPPLSSLEKGLV
jgi:hypothetical protein